MFYNSKMSFTGSGGDDQSEDGELRHSPTEVKAKEDVLDFRLVSYVIMLR